MTGNNVELIAAHSPGAKLVRAIAMDGSARRMDLYQGVDKKFFMSVSFDDHDLNKRFVQFSQYFSAMGFNSPKIYSHQPDFSGYLCQYLGDVSFAETIKTASKEQKIKYYEEVFHWMERFYIDGRELIVNYPERQFNRALYLSDITYFKEQLANIGLAQHLPRNSKEILNSLIDDLCQLKNEGFVHRDFQARNIMHFNSEPWFIDYQDAALGPDGYDLASLLLAGSANLEFEEKIYLLKSYLKQYPKANEEEYLRQFFLLCLLRKLRSFATYSKLGLMQKNAKFIGFNAKICQETIEILEYNGYLSKFKELLSFFNLILPICQEIDFQARQQLIT